MQCKTWKVLWWQAMISKSITHKIKKTLQCKTQLLQNQVTNATETASHHWPIQVNHGVMEVLMEPLAIQMAKALSYTLIFSSSRQHCKQHGSRHPTKMSAPGNRSPDSDKPLRAQIISLGFLVSSWKGRNRISPFTVVEMFVWVCRVDRQVLWMCLKLKTRSQNTESFAPEARSRRATEMWQLFGQADVGQMTCFAPRATVQWRTRRWSRCQFHSG